jgi:hypothetical protein
MIEEWRKVVGWDGYEVSNLGQVRSVERAVVRSDGTKQTFRGSLLTRSPSSQGYWRVRLSNLPEVNHIDCNRANASLANLEWVTPSQNRKHGVEFGSVVVPYRQGSSANCAKLTEDAVRLARIEWTNGASVNGLARKHGVHPKTMRHALNGTGWAHVPVPAPPAAQEKK